MQFLVIRDGDTIFTMDFDPAPPWRFDELSKVALAEFHRRHPDVSLLDEDVILKWTEAGE